MDDEEKPLSSEGHCGQFWPVSPLSCGQKGDQGAMVLRSGAGWCRGVPATLRWEERAHMKWTRTTFIGPSQRYSACIYNNDHVLSGWVVIWADKHRQFDCLRLQMDLPQTVGLLLLVLSNPLKMQSYRVLHFRMFLCILLSPLSPL